MMRCAIIVNAYLKPDNSVRQAERLKNEFIKLSVACDIINHGYLNICALLEYDFIVYLDKDKYLSNQLENHGIRLFNPHSAIEVCDDKGKTYIELEKFGVPVPKTVFAPVSYNESDIISETEADAIIDKLKLPVVVKESFGSMGKGVFLANSKAELLSLMKLIKNKPHLYQEYVGYRFGEDVRVIVIGGKTVASMLRKNDKDFRSNIALGGKGEKIDILPEFKLIAEKVAKTLNLDYCGVDILFGKGDKPIICEVNSNAFFEEIEKISNVNVANLYCKYIIDKISEEKSEKA